MKAPLLARILGIAFSIVGILGFVPYVTRPAVPTDAYIQLSLFYGFLFAIFAVNVVVNGAQVLLGIWGLLASRAFPSSVRYCRWITWIFALLVILGVIPITNTLFGVAPLYGHDIWLHAIVALFAAYGAYGAASIAPPEALAPAPPANQPASNQPAKNG